MKRCWGQKTTTSQKRKFEKHCIIGPTYPRIYTFNHSFILSCGSIALLQVHYHSEGAPDTARILPKRHRQLRLKQCFSNSLVLRTGSLERRGCAALCNN